jgi:hypothetical protein
MTKVQEAIVSIYNMNAAELNEVVEAVKRQRTYLARRQADTFRIGDVVSFAARGMQIVGTVTKVNTKTVQVRQNDNYTVWRVHASLLKKTVTV